MYNGAAPSKQALHHASIAANNAVRSLGTACRERSHRCEATQGAGRTPCLAIVVSHQGRDELVGCARGRRTQHVAKHGLACRWRVLGHADALE
eukprot:scaffold163343_cov27-Tisochrysis_lutea.AAC.2